MPINVVHLIDTEHVSGPGKTILESARVLEGSEFRITIAAYGEVKRLNPYLAAAAAKGYDYEQIPTRGRLDPLSIAALNRLLVRKKTNILHTHGYKTDFLGYISAKMTGVRTVATVHGWIGNTRRARFYIKANRRFLRYFDRVIAVSEVIEKTLVSSGVSTDRLFTVHNAIDAGHYGEGRGVGALRQEYGFNNGEFLVGVVGRLSREKGQRDFMKTASMLAGDHPQLRFFMIGDGPDRQELERRADSAGLRGKVLFTGYRNDMPDVYESLDLLVLPSHTEGLPNVALEAMAMGKPVIGTNVGGVPSVVRHEETGLLVESGRPEQMADSIRRLVTTTGEAKALAGRALAMIEKDFSFEKRMKKIMAIYRGIC